MLTPQGCTLWAAVICVDPTFPTRGPGDDEHGRRRPWPRVPDQLTIVRAIRAAATGCATAHAAILRTHRLDGP